MSNACSRLHNILNTINTYRNVNGSIKELWIQIFDLKEKPDFEVYIKDADLRTLIYKARLEAEQYGGKEENPWLKHFDVIIRIFNNLSLKSMVHEINKDGFAVALSGIELCGFALKKFNPEVNIDKEELDGLIKEIDELSQKAQNINFPNDIKIQILDNLLFTKKAMVDFSINGSKDIRRAIDANVGQILLNQNKLNETQGGKDYINSTIGLMSKINTLFSFYNNVQALYSGALHLFHSIS
ncbi:hypothetical protein [Paenibacillus polymyxa]|uniref:hypothetical protein n=1 Tax=Paenibacillus polymyxa TaxID=1406 RepID=UPI00237968A2|nr:hypothetical protein [Paenibacillus polymyxa]WDM22299.1 hypothetical protein J4I02_01095 [Paenibacillus polymyxa]